MRIFRQTLPTIAAVLLSAALVMAQTPGAQQYPAGLDNSTSLFQVADNASTVLTVTLSPSATTATVGSTAKFPASSSLVIDNEIIYYTGKTSTTFTGLIRGQGGTAAATHLSSALVRGPVLAAHHNALVNAVLALQQKLGTGAGAPPGSDAVLVSTTPGASLWSSAPTINGVNIYGITGASGGVTNSGTTTIAAATGGSGNLSLMTNNVERMRIDAAGNITFSGTVNSSGLPLGTIVDAVKSGLAKNDAVVSNDGATTNGSTTFTSASHPCVGSDAGKAIIVYGAGRVSNYTGLNNALRTTITGCSGGSYVLALAASATTSGKRWVYGTNTTGTWSGNVYLPPGQYMMGTVNLSDNTTVWAQPGTTMIYSSSSSVFIFSGKHDVMVDGVGIDAGGNFAGNGAVTLIGGSQLSGVGVSRVTVRNCYLTDTFLTNNLVPTSASLPVGNIDRQSFNRHGVLIRDVTDAWILNNTFEHSLRIKYAGGSFGEHNIYIGHNTLKDTNENGISGLTGQAVTVSDVFIFFNLVDGVADTGNGFVIGDDGGGGTTQTFINIQHIGNECKGILPGGTACIQDKGTGVSYNIAMNFNVCDNNTATQAAQSTVMCINKANQSTLSGQTQNFTAIGNVSRGAHDYAALRFGNIGSGTIALNNVTMTQTLGGRCMRLGSSSNLIVESNNLNNCSLGISINPNSVTPPAPPTPTVTRTKIRGNFITLSSGNNTAGINLNTQVSAMTDLDFIRNTVIGQGVGPTNVYGVQDDNCPAGVCNGNSNAVRYIENDFLNINTASGTASAIYKDIPAHAVVTELPGAAIATVTGATPSVRGKRVINLNNTSGTTVTDFLNMYPGQLLTVQCPNANSIIQNGATIAVASASNYTCAANTTMDFMYDGTKIYETGRSPIAIGGGGGSGTGMVGWTDGTTRTVAASATQYMYMMGAGTTFNSTESNRQNVIAAPITITAVYIRTSSAQPGDGALTCTIRDGSSDTTAVVTVTAGGGAGIYSTTGLSAAIVAGHLSSFKCVNASASTSAGIFDVRIAF